MDNTKETLDKVSEIKMLCDAYIVFVKVADNNDGIGAYPKDIFKDMLMRIYEIADELTDF